MVFMGFCIKNYKHRFQNYVTFTPRYRFAVLDDIVFRNSGICSDKIRVTRNFEHD